MDEKDKAILETYYKLEKQQMINQKTKNQYSKILVSIIVLINILFVIATMYLYYLKGTEPVALITAFFGFTTVELWNLATIKKKKIDKENYNE